MTFLGETEHFSGKNGVLRWDILVRKQKHNVQKPIELTVPVFYLNFGLKQESLLGCWFIFVKSCFGVINENFERMIAKISAKLVTRVTLQMRRNIYCHPVLPTEATILS